MNHLTRYEPITQCWPLPPDLLLITVQDEIGTAITLTVTTQTHIEGPGEALVEMVQALTQAKQLLRQAGR